MSGYDVVFPARGRQLLDGGLNNKYERALIADNESPDCLNVVFSNGAVESRQGFSQLNTTAVGSFVVDGIYTRRDNTGAETMVVFAGGTAWGLGGASTFATIGSAQSVFTAGVRVATAQYENHMFIGNGGVTPYKYNGVAFTRHGVPAATGAVTVASNGAGVLTGDYQYKVTYVNSQSVEGDVGTATTTFNVTTKQIRLTSIPVAPQSHGVSNRRIYRTEAGGTTFKRLATITDNTTTTYDDNTADASLGVAAPTDNGEPPKYSVLCIHQNRVWCNDSANPNYLWYSDLYEPFTFGSTNFLPIGDNTFDLVRGVSVYDNAVAVQCDQGTYLVVTPTATPADWSVVKTRSPFGGKSPFGGFLYNNKLMLPVMQNSKFVGFGALSGATIDPEATALETSRAGSELKTDKIEDEVFEVQEAYVGNISAMVWKNKAYVTFTSGNGNTTNNRVFVFDFSISNIKRQEASWAPLTGINAAQFTIYDQKLYFGSSTANGLVYQLEDGTYSDNAGAINAYFWTKEFSGLKGHENLQKDFRKVQLLVGKTGDYYMTLRYRVDSDSGIGTPVQVDLNPGGSLWGTMRWGVDSWGGGRDQEEITVYLGQVTGKRIQFRLDNQNTAGQKFKVHGINFAYNLKGRR